MNCDNVKINLPEYIDQKLDKVTSEKVKMHLESCPSCQAQLEEMTSFFSFKIGRAHV